MTETKTQSCLLPMSIIACIGCLDIATEARRRSVSKTTMTETPVETVTLAALKRLSSAIAALGKRKGSQTMFEVSPTLDQECMDAWKELSAAQFAAKAAIRSAQAP